MKVYKLTKEELEAKKRARISKNQEFYRVDTPTNERPCSAPLSRPKKTPIKEQPTVSPKTPKSMPTPTKNTFKSNTKKTTSTTPKKTFTPQSAAKIASNIDLDSTQFLSPLKLKTPPQLDLLPLTSRILQQEISETSSESEKDKSLNISEEFFQEDDYHRFGEWSSNIQQNSADPFKVPIGASDNVRGNELDLIKNELSELRSNMIKLDPNARIVEKKLEERKQREFELEEKSMMLQHELDISRQSYAELEERFSKYREDTEDREMTMLQKIEELTQLLMQQAKGMYPGKNSMSMNNLNDMGSFNYLVDNQHSVYSNSYSNDEQYGEDETEHNITPTNSTPSKPSPQTDFIINGRPVLKNIASEQDIARSPTRNQSHFPQPIMRFETNPLLAKVTPSKTRVPYSEENKENMMTEYSEKLSDDVSPFATYRYPVDDQDGAIEIHRPLIVGRDFSNTIQNNTVVTKQHKDFSPPNSGRGLMLPPQSKVRKFNIREKH